ncbi:T9SS type A sorting domain-containing protein [Polaribacter sp.]|uniref:T9SS type A sorting domain-containing protein n=1 Tax=Polaribacter sp. TaxID=1920175 RepID=UPI004048CE70
MKKITFLLLLILPGFMVGQNLITEGGFEGLNASVPVGTSSTDVGVWYSANSDIQNNSSNSFEGSKYINMGDQFRSLRQRFIAEENTTYQVTFRYRNNNATITNVADAPFVSVRINDGLFSGNGTVIVSNQIPLYTNADVKNYGTYSFTFNSGINTDLNFYIFKNNRVGTVNNAVRLDNISIRKLYTFDGSTNSDFATSTNWDLDEAPDDDDIIIPAGQNVILNGGVTCGNISIDPSGSLTINGGGSLVLGSFTTVTGNITYKRTLQGGKWHFVTPPVEGATYNDTWIADNGIASGQGNNRGISTYQNGTADPTTGQWVYVQAGSSGTFETSKGYSLRRSVTGDVSFTGTYPTGAKPATVSIGDNAFNLVGNPYPTYLSISNFFVNNTAASSKLTEETVWIWDQSANAGSGGYVQKTSGIDGTFQIAPGQAFFISSGNASNIIFYQFNGTNQSDTFLKSSKTQAIINIASNGVTSNTEIYYLAEGTNNFDNGYDASKFTGVTSNFDIYTSQLSDGTKKLGRQVLSDSNMETLVVPLGVKAAASQELTFTAEAMNFPDGIKLFLEDRTNNTITRLDEANSEYKVTLSEALDGTGRFFLHTKSSAVLGTEDVNLTNVSIFKTSKENLRIVGLTQGTASLKLYNVSGKQLFNANFQAKGANDITLPKLATGMYIIQLQTENGRTNKKIILE